MMLILLRQIHLKDEMLMDTSTKVYLQGIGEKTIQIRGKTCVPIIKNDVEIITEFPVVNSKFQYSTMVFLTKHF